jgi:four helix bundle protein
MRDFKTLIVWKKAHSLAIETYKTTITFPKDELYSLVSQIRRAAISIPANIAEGCGRGSSSEFRYFIQVSLGSAAELEYHLLLSRDLRFLSNEDYEQLTGQVTEVKRMLTGLAKKLKADS